jgi:hypothetical protein
MMMLRISLRAVPLSLYLGLAGLCAPACSTDRDLGREGAGGTDGGSGGGTTGPGADPVKEQEKTTLDACALPTPCPTVAPFTYLMGPDATPLGCIDTALAQGGPVHVSYGDRPDAPGQCDTVHEIYVGQDRTVMHWWRTDTDCSSAVSYTYGLERCTLDDAAYFAACEPKDAGGGNTCGELQSWVTGCVPASEASCP